MLPSQIPFKAINWSAIEKVEHKGENGIAYWQTVEFSGLRLRIVTYSEGYHSDHWCKKGHIVHCLEGQFTSHQQGSESFPLEKGMSYIVSDDLSIHRSVTSSGATLLIIDGDFLGNGDASSKQLQY